MNLGGITDKDAHSNGRSGLDLKLPAILS